MLRALAPFLLLAVMSLWMPAPAMAAGELPDALLGFGRNSTKEMMLQRAGTRAEISGAGQTEEYQYSWLEGQLNARFSFVPGDSRIQQIVVMLWPNENFSISKVRETLAKMQMDSPELDYLMAHRPDIVSDFGEPPSAFMDAWLTYPLPGGGSFEFYLADEPMRCVEMTLRFDYEEVPEAYAIPIPPKVIGTEDLTTRSAFFGLSLGLNESELLQLKGEPEHKETWSEDYPDWYYAKDGVDFTCVVGLSKVGEWDAEYDEQPGAFLVNRIAIETWSLDSIPDLDAARQELVTRGWDDPLLTTIGLTRTELRKRFGDPDSYSSYSWFYEIPGEDYTIAVDFRFSGSAETARVTGVTVSRW